MRGCHPADPFRRLDMRARWQRIGIVERCRLNIDDPGQKFCIAIGYASAAFRAETTHRGAGRIEDGQLTLQQCELVFGKGGPCNHRRACRFAAIGAMTKGYMLRFTADLIPDRAAMTSAFTHHKDYPSLLP